MTIPKTVRSLAVLILTALSLVSCRGLQPGDLTSGGVPKEVRPEDAAAVEAWLKAGGKGGFFPAAGVIKTPLTPENGGFLVDLDVQRAYFYQGAQLMAFSPIASGRRYYRTETGNYTLGEKDLNHRSTSYGNFVSSGGSVLMSDVQNGFDPVPAGGRFQGALMRWFMRFFYKGKPTAMGFHAGNLPGYPASHGCVRMPAKMAEWFFKNVPMHTPIYVRGTKFGSPIGSKQYRPKRSPKVHPSLKKTEPPPEAVPPAPESEPKTPEPAVPAPPAPAPAPANAPSEAPPPPAPPGE